MDDPLFSSMLKRSPTSLAHLLFHELTHRTIWIKGDVALNENLAEWVAIHLTTKFILHRNEDPKAYEAYLGDRDLFASWVAELKAQLQSRYEAFDERMTIEQRREEKGRIFRIFTRDKRPKFRAVDFLKSKDFIWNNAAVIAHSLYLPDRARYEAAFRCSASQSVGQFLAIVAKHMKGDRSLKNLDQLCRPGSMIPS
jgi:predicted aminopeptidase